MVRMCVSRHSRSEVRRAREPEVALCGTPRWVMKEDESHQSTSYCKFYTAPNVAVDMGNKPQKALHMHERHGWQEQAPRALSCPTSLACQVRQERCYQEKSP